jgi:hypothetical protein
MPEKNIIRALKNNHINVQQQIIDVFIKKIIRNGIDREN